LKIIKENKNIEERKVNEQENYNKKDVINSRKLSILAKRTESVQNLKIQANQIKFISRRKFCKEKYTDNLYK